jgi:hypothetical protein
VCEKSVPEIQSLEILHEPELCRSCFYGGGRLGSHVYAVAKAAMKRLAEYVKSVLEEAKRQNPHLAHLDRLAEVLPPRRMVHWPYLVGRWDAE